MGYQIENYDIESLPMGGGVEASIAQHTTVFKL